MRTDLIKSKMKAVRKTSDTGFNYVNQLIDCEEANYFSVVVELHGNFKGIPALKSDPVIQDCSGYVLIARYDNSWVIGPSNYEPNDRFDLSIENGHFVGENIQFEIWADNL